MAKSLKDRNGVLSIKLGSCLTAPTKRFLADLREVAEANVRQINMSYLNWVMWQRDREFPEPPEGMKSFWTDEISKQLYADCTKLEPHINTTQASNCVQVVLKSLKTKTPWNHVGSAKWVHEAIIRHESNLPSSRDLFVSAKSGTISVSYRGCYHGSEKRLKSLGGDHCAMLLIPLFSNKSGRGQKWHACRLEVRQMSRGNRDLFAKVVSGEYGLCDSKIQYIDPRRSRRPGKQTGWVLNLTYKQPALKSRLNPDLSADLVVCPDGMEQPFRISHGNRSWQLGHSKLLLSEYQRMDSVRAVLKTKWRNSELVRKGRGRAKINEILGKSTRGFQFLYRSHQYLIIREALKFCIRNGVGTIEYREPSQGWRRPPDSMRSRVSTNWFFGHNLPFDWTGFSEKLKQKAGKLGIAVNVTTMKVNEWRELFGDEADGSGKSSPKVNPPSNGNGKNGKSLPKNNGKQETGIAGRLYDPLATRNKVSKKYASGGKRKRKKDPSKS